MVLTHPEHRSASDIFLTSAATYLPHRPCLLHCRHRAPAHGGNSLAFTSIWAQTATSMGNMSRLVSVGPWLPASKVTCGSAHHRTRSPPPPAFAYG